MNVNQKGVSGLIKVIDDLSSNEFYVFTAFDDHSPVDVIALDKAGRAFRLQVKYRTRDPRKKKGNSYTIPSFSVVNGKKVLIDKGMIDGWAVYMADDKKVVYIPVTMMGNKKTLSLSSDSRYGGLGEWSKPAPC